MLRRRKLFVPRKFGAECAGEAGDCLACGIVADAVGKPGAGDAGTHHVGCSADSGQALLDLGDGGSGTRWEAQAGQLRAVDDVHV